MPRGDLGGCCEQGPESQGMQGWEGEACKPWEEMERGTNPEGELGCGFIESFQ